MDKESAAQVKYFWRSSRNCVNLIYFLKIAFRTVILGFSVPLCIYGILPTMQRVIIEAGNFTFWASELADWMTIQFITLYLSSVLQTMTHYDLTRHPLYKGHGSFFIW
ncbi:hypothetical protein DFH11DRAFT_1548623 [Phellopilus nigrolimitatus]|nr:hypothetical protein DFH11DRAFT_1548623 [Phellopilus nigrolimitatus]